ncbi:MAG: dienelactone hydrolase family protein [Ferruginibacter sp.]
MIKHTKNILIPGARNHSILLDAYFDSNQVEKPVIIYVHGFNGFKDWGNMDIIAHQFAIAGFIFIKFNFSHNGTTPETPAEFRDLEAFGQNNYSIQLEDMDMVMNWVCDKTNLYHNEMDLTKICLAGHSLGGGISILHSARDKRITKLITWAGISECKTPWGNWSPDKIEDWKNSGVQYYENTRTKQQLPLYYQLFEDYDLNEELLNIKTAIQAINNPILACHGTLDTSVSIDRAYDLKKWQPSLELFTVESDHVFGRRHPWLKDDLPSPMQLVVDKSISFLG